MAAAAFVYQYPVKRLKWYTWCFGFALSSPIVHKKVNPDKLLVLVNSSLLQSTEARNLSGLTVLQWGLLIKHKDLVSNDLLLKIFNFLISVMPLALHWLHVNEIKFIIKGDFPQWSIFLGPFSVHTFCAPLGKSLDEITNKQHLMEVTLCVRGGIKEHHYYDCSVA